MEGSRLAGGGGVSPEPWPCLPSPRGQDAGDPIPGRVWTRVLGSCYFPRRDFLEEVGVLLPAHQDPSEAPPQAGPSDVGRVPLPPVLPLCLCVPLSCSLSLSTFVIMVGCFPSEVGSNLHNQNKGQVGNQRDLLLPTASGQ